MKKVSCVLVLLGKYKRLIEEICALKILGSSISSKEKINLEIKSRQLQVLEEDICNLMKD